MARNLKMGKVGTVCESAVLWNRETMQRSRNEDTRDKVKREFTWI